MDFLSAFRDQDMIAQLKKRQRRSEALDIFVEMHQRIEEEICEWIFKTQLNTESREEKRSRIPAQRNDQKQTMPRQRTSRAARSNRPKRRKR